LGTLDHIDAEHQVPLVKMIDDVLQQLSPEKTPSAYNSLKRILLGSKKAIESYTKAGGKLKAI
jgi:aminopeptidase N